MAPDVTWPHGLRGFPPGQKLDETLLSAGKFEQKSQ